MNKAFVKESDSDDDADLTSEANGPLNGVAAGAPAGTPNYISTRGYARLKQELLNLLDKDRPDLVKVVAWAASNGDRSENADYHYGKKRLREIDRRIRFLTKRLDIAQVVNSQVHRGSDQVFFGATVVYEDDAAVEHQVTIVGVDEADPLAGQISWISPVAMALRKARVGDTVAVNTPGGSRDIEILSVDYLD